MPELDDPGWPPLHRSLLGALVPVLAIRRAQRADDALVVLRAMFTSFLVAILAIGIVTVVIAPEMDESLDPRLAALLAFAAGVGLQAAGRTVEGKLPCGDAVELADAYRQRFFLRIAFAEASALVAFVLVILSGAAAVYLPGLAVALVGFGRLAPSAANLQRDQDELLARGCGQSLVRSLRGPADPTTRRT